MFYLIGIGLGDVEDVTVKGLRIIKQCKHVYLENYTSILPIGSEKLEEFYGRSLILADRDLVEQGSDEILNEADKEDIALLVVGDPFGATTHVDLLLRAKERNIPVEVVHNASIMNAIGCCGLQLYSFGETISIPFWTDSWKPTSFYERIISNKSRGLHTLCLLDIKVKEQTLESYTKKKKEYMPPRYMTVAEASKQLFDILEQRKNSGEDIPVGSYDGETRVVGVARVGFPTQKIIYGSLAEMINYDLGPPLHSLVIPGSLQPLEEEYLAQFLI